MGLREKEAEKRALDAIAKFEKDYKAFEKLFENRAVHKNWRDEQVKTKEKILALKDVLLNIEV